MVTSMPNAVSILLYKLCDLGGVMGCCKSINVIFLLIVLVLVYFIRFCHGCIRFCYLVEWQNIINGLTFNNKSYFAGCFWWLFLDTVFLL